MRELILTKNRQVKHCPPHFTKVTIIAAEKKRELSLQQALSTVQVDTEATIRDWLHRNIENRFFIGKHVDLENNFFIDATIAAFEDPQDATYFSLVLPSLIND